MIPKAQRTQLADPALSRLQDQICKPLDRLTQDTMAGHTLLKDVQLRAGILTRVAHTLGRVLVGWLVVQQHAQADIWDQQPENASPDQYLDLNCSSDVGVDLVVF